MNLDPCLTSYTKVNLRYFTDLDMKARTTKLLEGNTGDHLCEPGVDKVFLNRTQKVLRMWGPGGQQPPFPCGKNQSEDKTKVLVVSG